MAASTQAASFVGAVLEQAGYIAQADFLRLLRDFFREAGAFVYILGAIGGLISYVMFGSFRAARYLVLGPALYWFLVGPTYNFDGVTWRVGNGEHRGLSGRRGESESKRDVKDVLAKSGISADSGINVAYGFALFARVINTVTAELAEVITDARNDDEYLRYVSKGLALDSALRIQITNPELINMLEQDFFARCSNAFAYSVAASAAELRPDVVRTLTGAAAQAAQRRKTEYEAKASSGLDDFVVSPSGRTRRLLKARGECSDIENCTVTCRGMWGVVADILETDAQTPAQNLITMAQGDNSDRAKSCERVLQKITGKNNAAGDCEQKLQRAVGLMMLKNTVFDRRASSRFVKQIAASLGDTGVPQDVQQFLNNPNPISGSTNALSGPALEKVLQATKNVEALSAGGVGASGADGIMYHLGMVEAKVKAGKDSGWDQARIDRERNQAKSIAKASAMVGTMDAGLTEYPKYHLRSLRQQLFSWAVNLPYWQGVLLYVLAASYPFMALIVLLPGRAAGFMNLPMAWIWVKSWDVGLAFVMLFERVLWNVLPSLNVPNQVLSSNLSGQNPWELFGEAQKFDHTWNLHIYYIALSMVTLSIPAVTGYATLRARRAVLSSFTEKLADDAKDAGQLASGSYGTTIMAERSKIQNDLQAAAMSLAGRRPSEPGYGNYATVVKDGQGQEKRVLGERELRSREYAANAAFASLTADGLSKAKGILGADWSPDKLADSLAARGVAIPEIKTAVSAYNEEYAKQMSAWHALHQAELGAYHPTLGRWGTLGIANLAYVAAVDGFGGYEIEPAKVSAISELMALHQTQLGSRMAIAGKIASSFPQFLDSDGKWIPVMPFADAMDYMTNPAFRPNKDTIMGGLMAAASFGHKEELTVPSWVTRTEGGSWANNQGMYNAEIASWKARWESGNKVKGDGSPISEAEYKQSVEFHDQLNKKMHFGPEGIFHQEVAPGQYKLQVPEKLIELMIPNMKLDTNFFNFKPGSSFETSPYMQREDPKPSVFEPVPAADKKEAGEKIGMTPASREEIRKHYESEIAKDRDRKELDQQPRTWRSAMRDMQEYESLFDLFDDESDQNREKRLRGRAAIFRSRGGIA